MLPWLWSFSILNFAFPVFATLIIFHGSNDTFDFGHVIALIQYLVEMFVVILFIILQTNHATGMSRTFRSFGSADGWPAEGRPAGGGRGRLRGAGDRRIRRSAAADWAESNSNSRAD